MNRLYLMPMVEVPIKDYIARQPKYLSEFLGHDYSVMDMGLEPACFVYVENVDVTLHNTLVAHADVVSSPENLDQQIGAALTTVKNAIEALNIPAQFVQASDTYRATIRSVAAMFQFLQALNEVTSSRLLSGSVNLNTRFNQLPQAVRADLIAAATLMNFDSSSLSGSSTLRIIFKTMADQWGSRPISIGTEI